MDILTIQRKERAQCTRCKRRRNIDRMVMVFRHPTLCPSGVYACKGKHHKYGECLPAVTADILMISNTGLIHVTPAVKSIVPAQPAAQAVSTSTDQQKSKAAATAAVKVRKPSLFGSEIKS